MKEVRVQIPDGFSNVLANQIEAAAISSVSATMIASKNKWESIAANKLHTTRADYLLGLNAEDSLEFPDAFTGVLTLRGKWPNKLEKGFGAYDIKDVLKNSPKVKHTKDGGWYITVPFRHRTPGTSGSAAGGQAMPGDIYSRARVLAANTGRLTGTEQQYPPRRSWTGYQHKSGIFEGMKRNVKKYDKAIQSTYVTFRRVSNNSDPDSWWHPGFVGVQAVDDVERFAEETFGKVIRANLKRYMG